MKKPDHWRITMALVLLGLSLLFYSLHYVLFRDLHHIAMYLVGDVAFLFIDVFIVVLLLEHLLARREKQALLKKLNMVIGTFFSETGTDLIRRLGAFRATREDAGPNLIITAEWGPRDFAEARRGAETLAAGFAPDQGDLAGLGAFLAQQRPFLVGLLQNPNLLEHETFTDLLWAVFHVADELAHRANPNQLSATDQKHLAGDLQRAYRLLLTQWLDYMQHLKQDYPYLFSLAVRTNPFDPAARPEVAS